MCSSSQAGLVAFLNGAGTHCCRASEWFGSFQSQDPPSRNPQSIQHPLPQCLGTSKPHTLARTNKMFRVPKCLEYLPPSPSLSPPAPTNTHNSSSDRVQLHLLELLKQAEQWPPHAQLLRPGTLYSVTASMDICYSAGLTIGAVMNVNEVRFSAPHTKSDINEAHTPPVPPLRFTTVCVLTR